MMDGITRCLPRILSASRILIVACGTSWHAGLVGEYLIETLARQLGGARRHAHPLKYTK